jgi:predicted GNAT family acetyltransferase
MRVDTVTDAKKFLETSSEELYRFEAEHNLILSLAEHAAKQKNHKMNFYTLSNDDGFVMAAVHEAGHNFVVSRAVQDGVEFLAEHAAAQDISFPGIVGPADVAAPFANAWSRVSGKSFSEYMDQIIYSLKTVTPQEGVEGSFRLARADEKNLIAGWVTSFTKDAHLPKCEQPTLIAALTHAEERIAQGRIGLWCVNDKPVAQASWGGTDRISRISLVYTPPEHRGKGYASAVVAALSQKRMDEGKKSCCLYADARNPVSNSIYRKIGYEFVGRSSMYALDIVS